MEPVGQKVPGGHWAVHDAVVSEGPAPYNPAGQRCGVNAPATQNDPGGHGRVHSSPRPVTSLNVPAAQRAQSAAAARLYRPGGHCTAVRVTEPAGHAYPASHGPLQEGDVAADRAPYRPPVHGPLQLGVPRAEALPNRPGAQALQTPAPGREYAPAGQAAAVALVEPAGHTNPALQAEVQALVRAVSLLHVPSAQLVHAAAPPVLN